MNLTSIPLVDVKAQYLGLKTQIDEAINQVVSHGQFILGPAVAAFEQDFADFVGARFAVGVGCGLDALRLALNVLGVGPGDEVVLPANTFIATALAVSAVGATPVLVDIDSDTYHWNPGKLAAAITPRTKVLLPVHLYGRACDMEPVIRLAASHRLAILEDACQAHGARWKGQGCGSIGALGAFSFYPGKNLGGFGDGGMVVTSQPGLAQRLKRLRNYGQSVQYQHEEKGINSRLDSIQAAVLRVKLAHLSDGNRRRHRLAQRYSQLLSDIAEVAPPEIPAADGHVFHLFVIRAQRRDALLAHLRSEGILAGIHYPIPIHRQSPYLGLCTRQGAFHTTESIAAEILSLPLYPELLDQQVDRIADAIRCFYRPRV